MAHRMRAAGFQHAEEAVEVGGDVGRVAGPANGEPLPVPPDARRNRDESPPSNALSAA